MKLRIEGIPDIEAFNWMKPRIVGFIDVRQFAWLTGYSEKMIWEWARKQPDFPKPRKFSRKCSRWAWAEVLEYIEKIWIGAAGDIPDEMKNRIEMVRRAAA